MKFYVVLFVIAIVLLAVGCSATTKSGLDQTLNVAKDVVSENQEESDQESILINGMFILNTEKSVMGWKASKIVSNYHEGTISLSSGNLKIINDEFISGDFVIDMTTITDNDNSDSLVTHLKSEDFFNVNMYPTSEFVLSSISGNQKDGFVITGDLSILNNTNTISFPTILVYSDLSGDLTASASFSIDRTLWGITYGSGSIIETLGDKAIKDNIDFELDLVFTSN